MDLSRPLTKEEIGILRDIAANKVSLDDCSEWMRDRLCDLVWIDPQLTDTLGPSIFLTEAGQRALRDAVGPVTDNR
jgi:hypothetical protein